MGGWPDTRAGAKDHEEERFTIDSRPAHRRATRRLAVGVTLLLSTIGGLLALADGVPGLPAMTLGGALGITGLAAWTVYQIASRRNDGLLILALPLALVVLMREYSTLRVLGLSLVLFPVVAMLGVLRRLPNPDEDDEGPEDFDEDDDDDE